MKLKIKPYLFRLIKENILYIVSLFFLLILIITTIKLSLDKINLGKSRINILKTDINQLNKKVKLYQESIPSTDKLDEDIKLLNRLIPNVEDYFSVIYALDKLSEKTGFLIINYSVNVKKSTSDKLRLTVNGIGDSEAFLRFLEEYQFSGGRLITSDKIELNPEMSGTIKLNLTFYNKAVKPGNEEITMTDSKIFDKLESIKEKVSFDFDEEERIDLDYPKKNSLF